MRGKVIFVSTLFGAVLYLTTVSAQKQQPTPENVRLISSIQGPALYTAYCAVCHGSDGKGDGPMAASLKVHPTNLTRISARHEGTFPLAKVRRIISGDEQRPGAHGTQEMPIWGPIFSQVSWDMDLGSLRVDNLAHYLQDMQAK